MPFIDRKSNLTANNARASDVARAMTEHVAPLQQQKMYDAFRVQGLQAILYNRLSQGQPCGCKSKEKTVMRLAPDGKAEVGAINRVLTNDQFGVQPYNPLSPDAEFDAFDNFHDGETSPNDAVSKFLGDLNRHGPDDGKSTILTDQTGVDEGGAYNVEELWSQFDLGSIGFSDVSCPMCYGSGYIGGYSPFRGWRKVVTSTQVTSNSTLDMTTDSMALRPGTHSFQIVLPRGAAIVDLFRAMNEDKTIGAQVLIDGTDTANKPLLAWFDGQPHTVTLVCADPFTHFELQAGLNKEPVYFEFPKRNKSADISLLERTEPFQIILSPEVPQLDVLDIIVESQQGKALIVQSTNPWQTRNSQFLGWECQVRVAQPAELWRLLPARRHVSGQKAVNIPAPSKAKATSGLSAGKPQGFSF